LVVGLAIVLAACASPDDGARPTPTVTTSAKLLFEDQRLRPVRMTSGPALTYVQPETASQILCQLLAKEDWERLVDGRVGRAPLKAPVAGCQVATEWGMVMMQFLTRDDAFEADTTVAGRPATMATSSTGNLVYTVALTDDALRPAPRQYFTARRLLELQVIGSGSQAPRDVGARVLDEIVPLLVEDGEPLPDIDEQGHVRYVSTPLAKVDEFVDLPKPVQALQLCTVLREELRVVAKEFDVFDHGSCKLWTKEGVVVAETQPAKDDYPDTIAGRPAIVRTDPAYVIVRLHDAAEVELRLNAPDPVAFAERLVPVLVS
jgi:hypothetical protein